jgi:hypothetical protein
MANMVSVSVNCPLCKKSLMDHKHILLDKPSIKLNIKIGDLRGEIRLCSIYGSIEHVCNIDISDGDLAEFFCPHCHQILNTKEECDKCNAPMVGFLLDKGGKVAICSRKGCSKHYVAFEDIGTILKKFYDEYGF